MVIKSSRQFKVIPTHDVDLPRLAPTAGRMVTSLARAVVTNRDFNYTRRLCSAFLRGRDPFDTFDELMDRSEASGLQSHFFFMSGGVTRFDNYYSIDDPSIKVLMDRIRGRGHIIGFHPSYNAYNDAELFKQELQRLESVAGVEVKSGRHHYLRFGVGETWPIWEDNGMEWDSTLSFADEVGFRCGICLPFNVFDVKTRRSLALVEKPLIVMDGSLVTYQSVSNQEAIDKVKRVKETCRRFDGDFVFLWHNSAFFTPLWSDKTDILDYLYEA